MKWTRFYWLTGREVGERRQSFRLSWVIIIPAEFCPFRIQNTQEILCYTTNTTIKVSVTVQNTGSRQGKHSVELYTHDQYASIAPSVRRLRAFQKIELKAGEKKTVTFDLNAEDLEFVNAQLKRVTEPGEFDVMIGELKGTFDYR